MPIKCPNCGSTAQVKETFSNYSTSLNAQCNSYKCGCGCLFSKREYPDGRIYGEWHTSKRKRKGD